MKDLNLKKKKNLNKLIFLSENQIVVVQVLPGMSN